jgi:hypothetical protein
MSIISTATIFNRLDGSSQTLPADQAALKTYYQRETWSAQPLPPPGWEFIVPRYRLTRDLQPASRARYRFEPPFESMSDNSSWQFGEHPLEAGDIIESKSWPHPSFHPQNYSAERVLSYFIGAMKSRLPLSPFRGDRIVLADGISGALPVDVRAAPKPAPFDTRPAA